MGLQKGKHDIVVHELLRLFVFKFQVVCLEFSLHINNILTCLPKLSKTILFCKKLNYYIINNCSLKI